jgi:hypothetical protein
MNRGEEEKQAKAIELMVWRDENHMRGLFGLAGVLLVGQKCILSTY